MPNSLSSAVAVVCIALLVNPAPAQVGKCPDGDEPIFAEDLQAAPDCLTAHALHGECAWGSSGDAELSGVVIARCEEIFLGRLRRTQLGLRRRGEQCDVAYDQGHSIGAFQASMCREDLAVLYFRSFSRGPSQTSPHWPGPAPAED